MTTAGGSAINSNDVLAAVKYPDLTTGAPSSSYQESYTVNALGDNLTYSDRAGNVHTYSHDVLGGLSSDTVTILAAGFDGSVRRIDTAYDALGNGYLVTSCNAASGGSIVNQVEDLYNGLDQLVQEYQSHFGPVGIGTTPSVQYANTACHSGHA